jgi:hypothetical protein
MPAPPFGWCKVELMQVKALQKWRGPKFHTRYNEACMTDVEIRESAKSGAVWGLLYPIVRCCLACLACHRVCYR